MIAFFNSETAYIGMDMSYMYEILVQRKDFEKVRL